MMTRGTRLLLVGLVGLLVWPGAAYSQSPEIKDAFREFREFYAARAATRRPFPSPKRR